jgi:hypothetical protein
MEAGVRADELFADDADEITLNGTDVRKGTIAAFAHNAAVLEQADPASDEYARARADLRETVSVLRAAGMFDVFSVTLARAAKIVAESADAGTDVGD